MAESKKIKMLKLINKKDVESRISIDGKLRKSGEEFLGVSENVSAQINGDWEIEVVKNG